MAYPKYGSLEWELNYLKNRKKDPVWDFKSLTKIHTQYADGQIVMAKCKTTDKWITGYSPSGGFRYMLSLRSALLFNGVWRTEEDAKKFIAERIAKYGDDCKEVEYLHKKTTDEDVLIALADSNFKI